MNPDSHTEEPFNILIAEDSPTQARRLAYILEHHGYRVLVATNGREALERARTDRPTLIISDVVMPEMDGYELCRKIKTDPTLMQIPLILVTTLSDPEDVIRGLECRADNFIIKPYDEAYLLNRVRFVLLNREMRQTDSGGMGVEIFFNNHKHFITADRLQILNLLLSTYEAAIQRNKELSLAQSGLRGLNAQLESANKELESFSYSVSHDLRAPLRTIDGFSRMLVDKFSAQLPPEAQRLLGVVSKSALHMGQLIDDLLRFSRMGRQALSKQSVKTKVLVQAIVDELRKENTDRNIEVRIADLPDCLADFALLRQVFVNLLSNAFKYSRQRSPAIIEVDFQAGDDETTFIVRDNGAGFDMKYADKLFGVFQRLHLAEEFEGTGVGLCIVDRIIKRHGGRVWAEAKVDEGATFFFTLPNDSE